MEDKKIAIVTGAYRGSGLKISELLLKKGFKVYTLDLEYKKNMQIQKNRICYRIDLSNFNQIKSFVKFLKKREKKVDCLINNAGVSLKKTKNNFINYWEKTLKINLTSVYVLSEMTVPLLKKSKNPSIVNISSISSKIAMSMNPAYNASKAGILALIIAMLE